MARPMGRPAPALTPIGGANDTPPDERARAARAYAQERIDERDWRVATVDAYADRLAHEHWRDDAASRARLRLALDAYLDGFKAGLELGFPAGRVTAFGDALALLEDRRAVAAGLTLAWLGRVVATVRRWRDLAEAEAAEHGER